MRILVIDDDAELRECLKLILEKESFAVDCAADGEAGSYLARTNEYDAIILDNVLPIKTGAEVCREIRRNRKATPILLISALGDPEEKARLLDSGADDYLAKPYHHKELLARIRVLLRRPMALHEPILRIGNVTLDSVRSLVLVNGKEASLTRTEFAMLEHFLKNKGRAVSRSSLLEHVWGTDQDPLSRTLETHVLNLRRKLGDRNRGLIRSVPGLGYRLGGLHE